MVLTLRSLHSPSGLLVSLLSVLSSHVPSIAFNRPSRLADVGINSSSGGLALHEFAKRAPAHDGEFIAFAVLIPVLVLLSGLFAGLTLGYMSLDETQLNVLSISGTPEQKKYANKIIPIRKNGHLLLVTLLLANMIVNETLPVISTPILGGGVESVVASTVMIVIFSEIIPQSVATRYGLFLGAKMAPFVRVLIFALGIVSWPVAKLLEFVLGPHHGIIYRRAELKELIAMHSSTGIYGGDLKHDTVTIIGATLDLQEKVVEQAMTALNKVFMLPIDAKLDYETLKRICATGHSRVPVYEEIDVPMSPVDGHARPQTTHMQKAKKIIGILLVKQCVLLDPQDAVPLRSLPLNKVLFVPKNEPLLGILDRFQEGRSHIAVVSRLSVERAASVKKVVKRSLTQKLRDRVIGESSDEESDKDSSEGTTERDENNGADEEAVRSGDGDAATGGDGTLEKELADGKPASGTLASFRNRGRSKKNHKKHVDIEMGLVDDEARREGSKTRRTSFVQQLKPSGLMQNMPADAVLAKEDAEPFLQSFDPAVMPLGIITLEDVLEELIGEEIYDEFDPQGGGHVVSYDPPDTVRSHGRSLPSLKRKVSAPELTASVSEKQSSPSRAKSISTNQILKPISLPGIMGFNFLRSRSAPPTPRDQSVERIQLPASVPELTPPITDEEGSNSVTLLSSPRIVVEGPNPERDGGNVDEAAKVLRLAAGQSNKSISAPPATTVFPADYGHGPGPRSTSPVPSLEAVLLDRKRRMAGGNVSVVSSGPGSGGGGSGSQEVRAPVPRVASPSAKTSRFKSSPLSGGENGSYAVLEE